MFILKFFLIQKKEKERKKERERKKKERKKRERKKEEKKRKKERQEDNGNDAAADVRTADSQIHSARCSQLILDTRIYLCSDDESVLYNRHSLWIRLTQ